MNPETIRLALNLRPVDTLFFRDARPFEHASQVQSGLPLPQTLAGALRTLLLEQFDVHWGRVADGIRRHGSLERCLEGMGKELAAVARIEVSGPWLSRNGEVLVAAPVNLREEQDGEANGTLVRLDPLRTQPPGWMPKEDGMLPLWHYGRGRLQALGPSTYLRPDGLAAFLEGGAPCASARVKAEELYASDARVGIGLDATTGTAATGMIYSAQLLALKPDVHFYAEVSGPEVALAPLRDKHVLMRFGGEGKVVSVEASTSLFRWPRVQRAANRGRTLLLITPAALKGWRPEGLKLISAAVGKPRAVSGWDMARGAPKSNRFMVPAGSVYFVAAGAPVPSFLGSAEDRQAGWGNFLEGNWNYV